MSQQNPGHHNSPLPPSLKEQSWQCCQLESDLTLPFKTNETKAQSIRVVFLLSQRQGRGMIPAISSPKHVPTGVPSPVLNWKEWAVLGFFQMVLTHDRDSKTCVQFHNYSFWQFVANLGIHSASPKWGRQAMETVTWLQSHASLKSRWGYWKLLGQLSHQNIFSKAMIY